MIEFWRGPGKVPARCRVFEPKLRNKPNITSTYKLINFMKGTALTVMRVQLFSERKNIERNIKNDVFLKKQLELIKETA